MVKDMALNETLLNEVNEEIISDMVKDAIAHKDVARIRSLAEEFNIVDIAESMPNLDTKETLFLIRSLTTEQAADVFAYLEPDIQEELVNSFSSAELKTIMDEMFSDEIMEFLDELPANLTKKVLKSASTDTRNTINELLRYGADTAGSIMNTEFVYMKEELSAQKALNEIRKLHRTENIETFNYIYTVDAKKKYAGYVEFKDLVFADETTTLADLAKDPLVHVKATDDQEVAAEIMKKYDLSVIPVVNTQDRLVGIITADDIIDVIQEEATEDIQKMAAVAPTEYPYSQSSSWEIFKSRIGWLLILMVTATFTHVFLELAVDKSLLLIFATLIPLMMDTAGNAGGQSGAVIIRALSTNDISTKDYFKVVVKEMKVAVMIGVILMGLNTARLFLLGAALTDAHLQKYAIFTSLALFFTIIIAKFLGASLPIVAKKLKLDPAVVAAPLITTIVDFLAVVILFIVFTIAINNGLAIN